MMKHIKQILLLATLLFLLSACTNNNAGATGDESAGNSADDDSGTETDKATAEMDEVNQLIFGTLMLDSTSEEVTTEQAETFLPLWQLYEKMSTEDATASEELDAIIEQIKIVFTEEQLAAMADLDYSNMMEMMSELGLESLEEISGDDGEGFLWAMPGNGDFEDMPEDMMPEDGDFDRDDMPESSNVGGGREGGGSDMGSMAGGSSGTGVDITGSIDPNALATAQAEGTGTSRTNRRTQMYLTALIEYLEIKAES